MLWTLLLPDGVVDREKALAVLNQTHFDGNALDYLCCVNAGKGLSFVGDAPPAALEQLVQYLQDHVGSPQDPANCERIAAFSTVAVGETGSSDRKEPVQDGAAPAEGSSGAVSVICFSKDRSFPLRECLRTMNQFVEGSLSINVLYTVQPQYEKAYKQIQADWPDVNFVREENSGEQLIALVAAAHDHVMLCCDDSLYYNTVKLSDVLGVLSNPQIVSYHMMLHPKLSFCHPQGKASSPPTLMPVDSHSVSWIRMMGQLEWNYPWDLSSTVYRKQDVVQMLDTIVAAVGARHRAS